MSIHPENFLSIRNLYNRRSERLANTRMAVASPASEEEHDYRDLLSEANLNFFHREYSIALQNYLALRQKILQQSHPEMPELTWAGIYVEVDWSKVKLEQLSEFIRRRALKIGTNASDLQMFPLDNDVLIRSGEFPVNSVLGKWTDVGFDSKLRGQPDINILRAEARDQITAKKLDNAVKIYDSAIKSATDDGNSELAGHLLNESAAMVTTYASGDKRQAAVEKALSDLTKAEQLFLRAGNLEAVEVVRANRANLELDVKNAKASPGSSPSGSITDPNSIGITSGRTVKLSGGQHLVLNDILKSGSVISKTKLSPGTIQPQGTRIMLVMEDSGWESTTKVIDRTAAKVTKTKTIGLFSPTDTKTISLDSNKFTKSLSDFYKLRISMTALEGLNFYEVVPTNFVAYFVHLYFFVLPISIGDTYAAMGLYDKALKEYRSVLTYPYLNLGIEKPYLWLKMADAYLQWGNNLYRREDRNTAKQKYEFILRTDLSVPDSELYKGKFTSMSTVAAEVIKELKQQPHDATNPKVAAIITQAAMRLKYIAQNFNFFGVGADYAPIFRFKYLQSAAIYIADNAVEAERTFIGYRSTAENQKIEHIQLQGAVDVNQAALAVENKRLEDSAWEVEAARRTREYAEVRKQNADDTLAEWNTKGVELTSMNAALSWASAAANDQDIRYTGVQYDGASHNYEGTVEEFFDTVGERREWLDWELQRNRILRQQAETAAEVAMAQTREQQALVRYEVQQLNVLLQQKRLDASMEVLEYAENRLFDEDLWFQLAAQLQDLARSYLDAAIYAALLMERAYDLEFDRSLNRIRTDYGLGAPAGLLGGEQLKRDIISFTSDYLEHAQKKNPVRLILSLREEFPSGFATFIDTGILPFRTDLEIFDRRYPGTYQRKIKKIELFVEGLVPLEGANGLLTNNGINADWRKVDANWIKFIRVMPVERMVLSSYQLRRDITVFQPSEEMLGLFENMSPQCEWTLEIPRSGNNLDYNAISDIKFVMYFDADYHDDVATHVRTLYPASSARSTVLSARFQYPDEYFRLDPERSVDFNITPVFFAYNYESPTFRMFGVRLLPANGASVANISLSITRLSDESSVTVTTDANGEVRGAAGTMAPFAAWKGISPIDTWRVTLADGVDTAAIADVQMFYTYAFNYRMDGSLT